MKSFKNLPLVEKVRELYLEGTFIIDIRYYKYKINLYLYQNIYFEVFINDKNFQIEKIEPLPAECSRMQFYADQLNLGSNRINEKRGYLQNILS